MSAELETVIQHTSQQEYGILFQELGNIPPDAIPLILRGGQAMLQAVWRPGKTAEETIYSVHEALDWLNPIDSPGGFALFSCYHLARNVVGMTLFEQGNGLRDGNGSMVVEIGPKEQKMIYLKTAELLKDLTLVAALIVRKREIQTGKIVYFN